MNPKICFQGKKNFLNPGANFSSAVYILWVEKNIPFLSQYQKLVKASSQYFLSQKNTPRKPIEYSRSWLIWGQFSDSNWKTRKSARSNLISGSVCPVIQLRMFSGLGSTHFYKGKDNWICKSRRSSREEACILPGSKKKTAVKDYFLFTLVG